MYFEISLKRLEETILDYRVWWDVTEENFFFLPTNWTFFAKSG